MARVLCRNVRADFREVQNSANLEGYIILPILFDEYPSRSIECAKQSKIEATSNYLPLQYEVSFKQLYFMIPSVNIMRLKVVIDFILAIYVFSLSSLSRA